MNSFQIRFNIDPPFVVDLSRYTPSQLLPQEQTLLFRQRITQLGLAILGNLTFCVSAFSKASYSTLMMSGTSFKHIVLGYYGNIMDFQPPADIYVAVFKVVIWIISMARCILVTTGRMIYEHNKEPQSEKLFLERFSGPEIDTDHIRTKACAIDVSEVPAEVTVSGLCPLFDQILGKINTTDPEDLHYKSPLSFREGSTTYTVDELKLSLKKFVDHVNGRVPFLGTPPAYDTPKVMAFYQQIENAVRFSQNHLAVKYAKATEEYDQFMRDHGQIIPSEESPDREQYDQVIRMYKHSFEDLAQFLITLAIAGKHCGARYMGDAMEYYNLLTNETSLGQDSLKDVLIEILANERKEIARGEIQTHFGANTHAYSRYMSSLGTILAIPGTEHVIEHLAGGLDQAKYLTSFFAKYTVDRIHTTIQEKIKKSHALREKITDWFKDQAGTWNAEEVGQGVDDLVSQLTPILIREQSSPEFYIYKSFLRLQALQKHLLAKQIALPQKDDIDEFLLIFFQEQEVRTWCAANIEGKDLFETAARKKEIRDLFTEEQLGKDLRDKILQGDLKIEDFSQRILELEQSVLLSQYMELPVALRVIRKEKDIKEALLERREQERGNKFIEKLIDPDRLIQEGLSPELMEWLVVSQGILKVQEG